MRTIFYKKSRQNPQILKSRVSEILMKSQSRSFNQVSVSTVTVSTASLWITHFLLGHSYTEAKWGTCLDKLYVMLPQNIFVTLNQIIILCGCFKKSSTPATLCCNHQRLLPALIKQGQVLGLHKLHLTTYQAGDVINIFASVKIWLWLWPWFELLAFLCAKLWNNFLYLCWCVVIFNLCSWRAENCGGVNSSCIAWPTFGGCASCRT